MLSIELDGVTYAHADSVPLLADVSLRLHPGWTGVVGANGAGKTTLLRLLAGDLEPEAGAIRRPAGLGARLCSQRVERVDDDVRDFAWAEDGAAHRVRGALRLEPDELARWDSLSPGERKRWQVGAALAAEPDLLLLDEPTNHLDREARALLLESIGRYPGIGVVVSHDRALLDVLCDWTIRVRGGSASLHRGSYAEARAAWEAEDRAARRARERVRREQKKLRRRLTDRRERHARAGASARTSGRMKNARDSDARLRHKQKRRRSAEAALGREIGLIHGQLGRLDAEAERHRFDKELGREIALAGGGAPTARIAHLALDALRAGERVLARDVRVEVERASRIWITGPNGAGKTTLLRELVRSVTLPAERWLHLPQELGEAEAAARLDAARALDPATQGRLLQLVAALGVDPAALLASAVPSPGEARKLVLADALAREVWALFLDEPTNHLDLPSIERVEAALAAYPGALVVVSHDDAFARRLTDRRWDLDGAAFRAR